MIASKDEKEMINQEMGFDNFFKDCRALHGTLSVSDLP